MFNTWMVFPGQHINITHLTQQQMVHCVIFFLYFFCCCYSTTCTTQQYKTYNRIKCKNLIKKKRCFDITLGVHCLNCHMFTTSKSKLCK